MRGGVGELMGADHVAETEHGLRVTVRLVVWEGDQIRDIKEQELMMAPRAAYPISSERLAAYLTGWSAALKKVLDAMSPSVLDTLMPHDFAAPRVLGLRAAKTAEDFERALLVRSRLGRFLPK